MCSLKAKKGLCCCCCKTDQTPAFYQSTRKTSPHHDGQAARNPTKLSSGPRNICIILTNHGVENHRAAMQAAELFLEPLLFRSGRCRFRGIPLLDHFRADHGSHRYLHPAHQNENDHRGMNRLDRAQLSEAKQAGKSYETTRIAEQVVLGKDVANDLAGLLAR